MNKPSQLIVLCAFLFFGLSRASAQENAQINDLMGYYLNQEECFDNWEKALQNADSVYCYTQPPNTMHTLPASVGKLKNLRVLGLGGNVLSELPSELASLSKLEEAYFAENQLYALPKSIGQLKKLRVLLLQYNQLEAIPEAICDCQNLTLLDLRKNPIKSLPECIYGLNNLLEIRVYGTFIPAEQIAQLKAKLPKTYVMDEW